MLSLQRSDTPFTGQAWLLHADSPRQIHLETQNRLHSLQHGPDSLETMLSLLDMEAFAEEHAAALGFGLTKAPIVPDAPRMYVISHTAEFRAYARCGTRAWLLGQVLLSMSDHIWGPCRRIPLIFHQIFLSGEAFYEKLCVNPKAKQRAFTRESCLMYHQHWQHVFWYGLTNSLPSTSRAVLYFLQCHGDTVSAWL